MTPLTILAYLVGKREAILRIASTRAGLVVGLLLVLCSGLARNYDGAYLPVEWPVLLHGPVVSTVNAVLLFGMVWLFGGGRGHVSLFWRGVVSFLGLFWMTAPTAWLYGIPYERFLSPLDALRANAATLALVSVWRIALVTRVLAVLFGASPWRVLWIVLLFADATLLLALKFAPLPVIDFMGGMQQSPEERALGNLALAAVFWGVVTLPVWFVGALVVGKKMRPSWALARVKVERHSSRSALAFAAMGLVAWLVVAAFVLPEQRLRHHTEQLLRSGRIDDALGEMSRHSRTDYPPVWDPPPRPAWRIDEPPIRQVRAALAKSRYAAWVEQLMWAKCWKDLAKFPLSMTPLERWSEYADSARVMHADWWNAADLHAEHDPRLSDEERGQLRALLEVHRGRGSTP